MQKSIEFIKEHIKENDTVVCATSGGVDSMTLLFVLIKLRESIKFNIICAHVNHSLREESKEEYEFVKKYVQENNIIFEGTKFDNYTNKNIEAQARDKRYQFFDDIIKKYNAKYLLTAHHGDDLIETILMKLTRGSSLDGYIGFSNIVFRDNYTILRPLVFYTKEDICKYASENNIEYREDKTNFSEEYTRNRYRKKILPLLKYEDKNVHLKYLKYSNMLKENNEFINRIVDEKFKEICDKSDIDIKLLKQEDIFIQKRIIYKYLQKLYKDKINLIQTNHIDSLINLINSTKPNLKIDLPGDIIIQKQYDILNVYNIDDCEQYKFELSSDIKVPGGYIRKLEKTDLTSNYVCFLNSNDLELPLFVRNKENGDTIDVLGLNKAKKVKDIFINEKIDINKRKNYPVVVDSTNKVVWIPGIKKSKYDAIKTKKYDIILWYDKEEYNEQ